MTRTADRESFLASIIITAVEGPYGVATWAIVNQYGWYDPAIAPGTMEPSPAGGGNAAVSITYEPGEPGEATREVDLDTIERGLRVLRQLHPDWYSRSFAGEDPDYDQIDADAVLQCGVLGDVIYG